MLIPNSRPVLCSTEIVLHMDQACKEACENGQRNRMIVMSNHQLYTDWVYMWMLAYHWKRHMDVKIILKDSLRRAFLVGWGMQNFEFLFLARKWATDKSRFEQMLDLYARAKIPYWLLLYPEGYGKH